jgi:uncharacterized protein YneF (UPF0154 family)
MIGSSQSAGGIACGIAMRARALKRYNDNPNICKYCLKAIAIQEGQKIGNIRDKKFCNHSCAAKFSNHSRVRPSPNPKPIRFCKICLTVVVLVRRIICDKCKEITLGSRTKGELFKTRSNWQSARSAIRRHASVVWGASGKKLECEACGYNTYVEIAHIKAVSDFSDEALIQEINAIDNLKALCPNHHWELDNLLQGSLGEVSPHKARPA